MLDIKLIRKNPELIVENLAKRGYEFPINDFKNIESERKSLQTQVESLQSERNTLSKQIGIDKSKGIENPELIKKVKTILEKLENLNIEYKEIQKKLDAMLLDVPNLLHSSVVTGANEKDNKLVRESGNIPKFNFVPKEHHELLNCNFLDMELGAKLAGARFTVLKAEVAKLHRALVQFMLDTHTDEHGYIEVNVPQMVHSNCLQGTGQLPKFAEDSYKIAGSDHWLIPTAEVPVTNFVSNSVLAEADLPLKYVAHSCCFRSEAGSYGKDMKGIFRLHQFEKVEMVQIVKPENSYQALEEMLGHATKILDLLELPYRVVDLCSGDIGFSAAKTYDVEVWLPGQNNYREISSCSNTEDFQSRRIQARYKSSKNTLLHTLNGSGLAVGRTLIAVIENYQTSDGKINIPKVLKPYMRNIDFIDSKK